MIFHQAAMAVSDDSSRYVVGPFADAIASDPDLLLRHSGQVISACEHNIAFDPDDYFSMYRLGRVKQLLGKSEDARKLLTQAEERLRALLRSEPKNAEALTYLGLTLTRLGRFSDAVACGRRAVELDPRSADVKYGVAQIYSLQMYSGKKKEIDPKKRDEALRVLKQALTIHYRIDALANADFFNMRDLPEYAQLIRESVE
jgi:tetratricopeptide (TPR) repeat protein